MFHHGLSPRRRSAAVIVACTALFATVPPALSSPEAAAGTSVTSPDGRISLSVEAEGGQLSYSVDRQGSALLGRSKLGLKLTDGTILGSGAEIVSATTRESDSTWRPTWGADTEVRDHFKELAVGVKQADGKTFNVIARAYDDGVAFRYEVPQQESLPSLEIADEETEFAVQGDPTAWWTDRNYNSDENTWKATPYSAMAPSNAPVTLEYDDGTHLSIHEADLVDYAAMTISPWNGHLQADLVPTPERAAAVVTDTGRQTPWRALTISPDAAGLVESHLLENLNPPCVICDQDTSWIKPAKYVGIWWLMHHGAGTWEEGPQHGATTERAKEYIDFAAANGIQGLLAEGWNVGWEGDWGDQSYTRPTADFNLEEVVAYGKSKGVEFIAHNETGSNITNYEQQIDEAFALYERLGIHYVKTGYVGQPPGSNLYDQRMVNHFRLVLRKAAEHKINIDCHECIHATGEMRTYPNALSREAVRGQEYDAWSEGNSPEHTMILPFTRGLSGPMDYTPGIMDILWDPRGDGRRVHTTVGKQLAYFVNYFSGVQMAADLPEKYRDAPGLPFIRDLPAKWDQTDVLSAEVGEHLVTARRAGAEWYVGAMTGERAQELRYRLSFLGGGNWVAETYTDGPDADYDSNPTALAVERSIVTGQTELVAELAKSGGQAVRLRPATPEDLRTLPRHK